MPLLLFWSETNGNTVIEEKHMLANFKIVEMLSDDGAESMNTKQAVAALVRQAFALRLITQVYPHHHQIKLYRIW